MRSSIVRGFRATPVWLLAGGALALAFFLVSAIHFAQLPLRIEENEFPRMAKAIYETGKPVIEGETHRVTLDADLRPETVPIYGAWHPPLYLYTLGTAMLFVGADSPHALRIVGIAGLLVALILILLIARELTPRWRLVGGVASILLLVHPYAIQGSTFIDIDNSIYGPLALLAIWAAIRFGKSGNPLSGGQIALIGLALATVTWAKMTTSIVLAGAIVVWWLLSGRPWRRGVLEAGGFLAIGAAVFFSTYAVWCAITGTAFSYTFDVTFASKSNRLLSELWLVENAAHWHLRWFGAALALLSLVFLAGLVRNFLASRKLRPVDLLFLTGLGVLALYVVLSPTDGTYQGKYAFLALLTLVPSITWMLLDKPLPTRPPLHWLFAVAVGGLLALLLPDLLTNLALFNDYGTWETQVRVVAAVGAGMLLAWWAGGSPGFAGGVLVVVTMLALAQSVDSYRANTSPMYPIDDTADFSSALNDLRTNMADGEIALAPKDLGFYLPRVIEGEDAFARGDDRLAAALERYPEISAVARTSFGPPVGPLTQAVIDRCFDAPRIYGTASVQYRIPQCR